MYIAFVTARLYTILQLQYLIFNSVNKGPYRRGVSINTKKQALHIKCYLSFPYRLSIIAQERRETICCGSGRNRTGNRVGTYFEIVRIQSESEPGESRYVQVTLDHSTVETNAAQKSGQIILRYIPLFTPIIVIHACIYYSILCNSYSALISFTVVKQHRVCVEILLYRFLYIFMVLRLFVVEFHKI